MKFFTVTATVAACAMININFVAAETSKGASWAYKHNDADMASPEQWAEHYPTCGGSRQSPVDIKVTTGGGLTARSLSFSGSCGDFNLTESDESFKGAVVGGSCSVSANDATYDLTQFHLHSPSEHTIDGKALDGEAHFVHSNNAVTPDKSQLLNLASYADLINTKADADRVYNYPGSLTTPACDEIADWWVVPTPVKLSKTDFERLQKNLKELHVADDGKNARPVQPLNGRSIASLK
ncbi:hypothetical protein PHYSODRAFT_248915 [Phytophthora sojae]|uniref:carbonic anhydrase n=1 Tax=Phytophthora sojae (strain P6497) TaxID=1094619 RepID=G4ZXF4_PHYSP|nr:hypothetical protein PHYSODRAFT_248915 [Phytophthora sojae]EGZ12570.1 hypothetical protein PHYSODRAFT_248915 [Phytophthora sojae]|eukprot:XP_009532903.1 hypothetical protein PHYSODRAFT_248915 [Phytophthora sojae]